MSSETLIQPLAVSGEASTSRMQPALTGNATSLPVKKGRSKWQNIQAAQDASSSMPTHHLLSAPLSQAPPVPPSLFATPIPTAIPMPYSHSPVFYHSPIPLMPQVPIIQNVPLHYQTMLHAPPPHILAPPSNVAPLPGYSIESYTRPNDHVGTILPYYQQFSSC